MPPYLRPPGPMPPVLVPVATPHAPQHPQRRR
jgi:hypothetical protein